MYRDGICRVTSDLYSKTVTFGDINYHLAQPDDKTAIFENYSDFLNYYDSSVTAQITSFNREANKKDMEEAIVIPVRDDETKAISLEYGGIMRDQRTKGNNGLVKEKYVTYAIHADNLKAAKLRSCRNN